jgi:D-glycero-beta-D-manno-heptose 1-phosphate adenylyltransferase
LTSASSVSPARSAFDPGRKILSRPDAARWREKQPGRVVFTNGVFDLLHPGHIDLLTEARGRGAALVVGLNSDASVRRLKGGSRPLCTQTDRAYVIAGLESVDAVVVFDEDTPLELVKALRPDVIVKGGDYTVETVVGAREVLAGGGEVVIVPTRPGGSTTAIVERLLARGRGPNATP